MDIAVPRGTHHTAAHHPQHGTTLMRHAVTAPAAPLKRHTAAVTPTDILVARTPSARVVPKLSYADIDPQRLARAGHIAKSKLVSRFAPSSSFAYAPGPAIAVAVPPPVTGTPEQPSSSAIPAHPSSKSMDIFQRALKNATAHEQPPIEPAKRHLRHAAKHRAHAPRKFRHRTATLVSSAVAVVLIAGFIAYQNKANLELRVATAATGVHATLPGFKPSGFALGKLSYTPGVVAAAFHDGTTGSSYKITQQNSSWDSATLLDSYVATRDNTYQAMQAGGRTVYIYGNNNATWVSGGIWYQITDNGSLTTNDVLDIAQSM